MCASVRCLWGLDGVMESNYNGLARIRPGKLDAQLAGEQECSARWSTGVVFDIHGAYSCGRETQACSRIQKDCCHQLSKGAPEVTLETTSEISAPFKSGSAGPEFAAEPTHLNSLQ